MPHATDDKDDARPILEIERVAEGSPKYRAALFDGLAAWNARRANPYFAEAPRTRKGWEAQAKRRGFRLFRVL